MTVSKALSHDKQSHFVTFILRLHDSVMITHHMTVDPSW